MSRVERSPEPTQIIGVTPMERLLSFAVAAVLASSAPSPGDDSLPQIEGAHTPAEEGAIDALHQTLDAWLSVYSDYPETERPVARILVVEPGYEFEHLGRMTVLGGTMRGAYASDTATIYLLRPWNAGRPRDQSVLLHELVHHRQVDAKHWYCGQAMEWDAYKLQEEFLAAHGIDPEFHWTRILLESSCAVRDHHPG
jgi:hypothetical protein